MKLRSLLFVFFVLYCPSGSASDNILRPNQLVSIEVGGTMLTIPVPEGFVDASKNAALMEFGRVLTPKNRRLLALLVPKKDLDLANSGIVPDLSETLTVQTAPADEYKTLSTTTFLKVKEGVHAQHKTLAKAASGVEPDQVNAWLREQTPDGVKPITAKLDETKSLGVIEETEHSITVAFRAKTQLRQESNNMQLDSIATITIAIIRGKPLWLGRRISLPSSDDVEVIRRKTNDWIASIVYAN